ncbi:hypothetical protein BJV77DRAFT_1071850 [Russula vinacea]|nr:hypothetical protein BJV77DRAFT_1071850 [Russula vinacea]
MSILAKAAENDLLQAQNPTFLSLYTRAQILESQLSAQRELVIELKSMLRNPLAVSAPAQDVASTKLVVPPLPPECDEIDFDGFHPSISKRRADGKETHCSAHKGKRRKRQRTNEAPPANVNIINLKHENPDESSANPLIQSSHAVPHPVVQPSESSAAPLIMRPRPAPRPVVRSTESSANPTSTSAGPLTTITTHPLSLPTPSKSIAQSPESSASPVATPASSCSLANTITVPTCRHPTPHLTVHSPISLTHPTMQAPSQDVASESVEPGASAEVADRVVNDPYKSDNPATAQSNTSNSHFKHQKWAKFKD